ncbi:UDP-N-acetylglucosamine 2-epimerase (non-hydrolyzing) [Friedmanniella endophytica]|uniref:UDP-N-acetylglucosamine 2-epimerase (non-hydrolyzing) n=1 Tax=Microlunatus kandeliicorticis TaxID=1759536 RepID=A0A7W3IP74_9ACTN|nr:UDP-N-acetylglucosamine 2-epimerase (non-hydrolyzing) [Microlunatus kandeliicorticis]MBA8792692.1 UDP-N-acetylglucosamine 2-epimerase (non-hydrolyzing) [Microlunatus kandeliicorticis]
MKTVLMIYGTRPEAIKLAPLVRELERSEHCRPIVAVTGQHREMLDQVNQLFGIVPDRDLNIIAPRQTLESITSRALQGLSEVIIDLRPDAVLVQGDTTTCFAAALAAFYQQVPVFHLEAGLRTGEVYNPFPEEVNRRLTTQLSALHLAPTANSRANLLRDNVDLGRIVITGNTVIDALLGVVAEPRPITDPVLARCLEELDGGPLLLVTSHRRESWGEPMARTAAALAEIAVAFPELTILLPAHLNPVVREVLLPPLEGLTNVVVTEPLAYSDFSQTLAASTVVLTDSGGVQEEAPSLGKPVLVMRETTERPEAVEAGTVELVGTDTRTIVARVTQLLTAPDAYRRMAQAVNPYGDGKASARAVAAIEHYFGLGPRIDDFDPAPPTA